MKRLLLLFVCFPMCTLAKLQGVRKIDSIVGEIHRLGDDTLTAQLMSAAAVLYEEINTDSGIVYAHRGMQLSKKLHWKKGEVMALIAAANNLQAIGKNNDALDGYKAALQLANELGNKAQSAQALGNIAMLYYYESNNAKALEYWLRALNIFEETNDTEGIAIQTGNIGSVYYEQKNFKKAAQYYDRARALYRKLDDKDAEAMMEGNIGNVCGDTGDMQGALTHYQSALNIYEQTRNKEGIGRNYMNMSTSYGALKQYDKALNYQLYALNIFEELNNKDYLAMSYTNIAEYYKNMVTDTSRNASTGGYNKGKKYCLDTAAKYADMAIKANEETGNLNVLSVAWRIQGDVQAARGEYKDAIASYANATRYKDSVFSLDNTQKITSLELNRELEIRDKQIEIDRLTISKKRNESVLYIAVIILLAGSAVVVTRNIKLASAKKISEEQLNVFQARMNPHFIFNSLNSIQSLVLNNETMSSIKYLSEFSRLMRQVLDGASKNKILLQTEIEMLRSYIQLEQLRFERFDWEIVLAEGLGASDIHIPSMIVQPFIENAIIHGILPLKTEGKLRVSFEEAGRQIICTVDDNGVGRERSQELNKRRNKDRESYGIDMTVKRLALLNDKKRGVVNTVTYIDKKESGMSTGTTVVIKIPVL